MVDLKKNKMTNDPKLIVQAAGQAQKAADMILNIQEKKEEEEA